jgi:serine/threonine protein phosphatase PrpC
VSAVSDSLGVPASSYETGVATHAGRVRTHNEDHFLAEPSSGLWAVADGMGGHEAGALASSTVVEALRSIGSPASAPDLLARLEDRILRANKRLREIARERGSDIVGSTIAALIVFEEHYACVWSGDSRVYLLRGAAISQLSRDHTEVQELVDKGLLTADEAKRWPRRNVLVRALGVQEDPELDINHGTLEDGDVFVICSDGLTAHVEDHEIQAHVERAPAQAACDALIALTLERGGTDNVTVVVMRYQPASIEARA